MYNAQRHGYRVAVLNHIGTLAAVPVTSPRNQRIGFHLVFPRFCAVTFPALFSLFLLFFYQPFPNNIFSLKMFITFLFYCMVILPILKVLFFECFGSIPFEYAMLLLVGEEKNFFPLESGFGEPNSSVSLGFYFSLFLFDCQICPSN